MAVLAAGLSVLSVANLFQLAPLIVLESGPCNNLLSPEQIHGLALLFIELNTQANNAFLAFFGLYCLLLGCLILRSTFLPRIIGVFMTLAGFGYLTFLSPSLAAYLSPYNLVPAALGEGSLMLWLLVMGVNSQRWREQADLAHNQ